MQKVRTIFAGTSSFAVPILEKLTKLEYIDIVAIITQPDATTGRHHSKVSQSRVKEFATRNNITTILQPKKLKLETDEIIAKYDPELLVVASYGQIIPEKLLDYPKYGALNIHGSLLPKLRGAVPVPMAILNGYKETGVTIQKMVKKLDAGDIIASSSIEIDGENSEELLDKLATIGAELLEENLLGWLKGEKIAKAQNEDEATFCNQEDLSTDKAEIMKDTDINLAERMIRAFYPDPGAWIMLSNGKRLKIFKSEIYDDQSGEVFKISREGKKLLLNLKNGRLELQEVQLEGKKRDQAINYLYLAE